jgi:hypothetical protein
MEMKAVILLLACLTSAAFCRTRADAATPRVWVECSANYKMFGHKLGSERPDECGTVGLDGPKIERLYTADGRAETSVTDKYVSLNIQAWPVGTSGADVGGMIRYKLPGRETFAVVTRGPVPGDEAQPLSLHSYLGEKVVQDKPNCGFSHYITVNCYLKTAR